MLCFFFFKQKTAYEMRISDWSSDVCSSDLKRARHLERAREREVAQDAARDIAHPRHPRGAERHRHRDRRLGQSPLARRARAFEPGIVEREAIGGQAVIEARGGERPVEDRARSEEHTSELQSLMRISYAVFCLK